MGVFLKIFGILFIILTIVLLIFSIYLNNKINNYYESIKYSRNEYDMLIKPIIEFLKNSFTIITIILSIFILLFGASIYVLGSIYNDVILIKKHILIKFIK